MVKTGQYADLNASGHGFALPENGSAMLLMLQDLAQVRRWQLPAGHDALADEAHWPDAFLIVERRVEPADVAQGEHCAEETRVTVKLAAQSM